MIVAWVVLQNGIKVEGKVRAGQSGRFLRPSQLLPLSLDVVVGDVWMLSGVCCFGGAQ